MINVHELEKRHFNYKLKSYIPYVIISLSIAVIAGIIFAFYNIDISSEDATKMELKNIPNKIEEVKKQKIVPITVEKEIEIKPESIEQKKEIIREEINTTVEVNKKTTTSKISDNKLVLAPSMNFMQNIDSSSMATTTYNEPVKKVKSAPKQQAEVIKKPKPQPSRQVLIRDEKSSIQIKKNNTYDDIQHVIKRFKKNNNPALSLFIAKKYYELGEYKKSYNYALRTNEINNNIEASWIIFAKSLVKLDRKDMAIKTLQKYINHSDSNKAKILLDEISLGKLHAN